MDNGVYNKFAQNTVNHSESSWESQFVDPGGLESRTERSHMPGNGDSIDKSFWDVSARSIEKDVDKQ